MKFIYDQDPKTQNWVYDLETYPNIFTAAFLKTDTHERVLFEISTRKDQLAELLQFLESRQLRGDTFIGFNNIGFDYPIIHQIMSLDNLCGLDDIYEKSQEIINTPFNCRFSNIIWQPDIRQIDLYKINHFDNISKATSLKTLEVNMGMDSVEDLPFPVGIDLTYEQMDTLIEYNWHDIDATYMFYRECEDQIKLREDLSKTYDRDFSNSSDSKIGSDIFISKLEDAGVHCYTFIDGKPQPKQTIRESIDLKDCIFPYIQFQTFELNRIHQWMVNQTVYESKKVFKNLSVELDGLEYVIGTGGLHASVNNKLIVSDDDYQIVDVDVEAMYPAMAIVNNLYPEHLGIEFCDVYKGLFNERKTYKKGTAGNAALKIAMNATYGNSGNKYSPFYDLKYLLSTTIGGQLSLLMLVEQLLKVPGLIIIQANTDGITYRTPRSYLDHTRTVCTWWEGVTGLVLEEALYSRFWIRDVNSYISEYQS